MSICELDVRPKDGITCVEFSSTINSNKLLVSSWDSHCYLYNVDVDDLDKSELVDKIEGESAFLDCCFGESDNVAYAVGLSRQVRRIDWCTGQTDLLGTHQEPIKSIIRCKENGIIFSGSWDCTMTAWDPRASERIHNVKLPGKVYTMDSVGTQIIVGMSERLVNIYDARKVQVPLQTRESALKYQTRCIRMFPDALGYVCSSIEGRVSIEYVDENMQEHNYAFKCHRRKAKSAEEPEIIYPINAVAFNNKSGYFATGGTDGIVAQWDLKKKKRVKQWSALDTSISSLSYNCGGDLLAIAASYCYEEGEMEHPPDSIYIRKL